LPWFTLQPDGDVLSHHIVAFSFSGLDCFTTDPD
jgi:hypothetical protein